MTSCRVEPSGLLVAGIDRLMGIPGSPLHGALAPALESGGKRHPELWQSHADLTTRERRVLIVATVAVAAGQHERAIEVVEQHKENCNEAIHPRIYERLAASYLAVDRAEDAITVVKSGLDSHEDSPGLTLMLINALASKSDWVPVLSLWENLPKDVRSGADAWTQIGVVRACRLTGNPAKAEELAREATASWPDNEILHQELRICRPHVIDWRRSWVSKGSGDGGQSAHGTIESTGFLNGGSLPLVGWLGGPVVDDPEVTLTVNGSVVARTVAAPVQDVESQRKFSINCADLLQYVGDGDVVEVINETERLALPGIGRSALLNCGYTSQIDELFDKLNQGFVFTKDGQLRPGLTVDRKRALLDYFNTVAEVIELHSGQPVYPFYGNLLGAIRHNDFIEHDIGGFDLLYLCRARESAGIRLEVVALCSRLVDTGFDVTVKPHSVMVRHADYNDCLVDLSYGWFDSDDKLKVSFGWRFEPAKGMDHFVTPRDCRLVDRDVSVPGNAEDVLVQLYGPNWRVPDQGFSTRESLKRDNICLLTGTEIRSFEHYKYAVNERRQFPS